MARVAFQYLGPQLTPTSNPYTLYQILAAANHRCVLKAIELMPFGSTGASAPLLFDVCVQDDANGMTADASNVHKQLPAAAETIQATLLKNNGGEPTTSTPYHEFSLHQQGTRLWVPPNERREIEIVGGTRLGIRSKNATFIATQMCLYLEE